MILDVKAIGLGSIILIWINLWGENGKRPIFLISLIWLKSKASIHHHLITIKNNLVTIGHKNKFFASKLPRTTEIDVIMKKHKSGPSPCSYNPSQVQSRGRIFQSKLDRNGFIEDARARANETPPPYNPEHSPIQPRLKGIPFLPTKKDAFAPIKKINKPDMGSYTMDKAFERTTKRIRTTSFSTKYKIPLIQDHKVNLKKWIPGAGAYKWEAQFDKTTRPPLRRKGKY
jgi:hypothetical protein